MPADLRRYWLKLQKLTQVKRLWPSVSVSHQSPSYYCQLIVCESGTKKDFSFSVGLTGGPRRGMWEWLAIRQSRAPSHLVSTGPGAQHWHQGHNKGNGPPMQHTPPSARNIWQRSDLSLSQVGKFLISAIFSSGQSGPRAVGGITDGGVIPGEMKESWLERIMWVRCWVIYEERNWWMDNDLAR